MYVHHTLKITIWIAPAALFFEAAERASRFTEADLKTHADIIAAGF